LSTPHHTDHRKNGKEMKHKRGIRAKEGYSQQLINCSP